MQNCHCIVHTLSSLLEKEREHIAHRQNKKQNSQRYVCYITQSNSQEIGILRVSTALLLELEMSFIYG